MAFGPGKPGKPGGVGGPGGGAGIGGGGGAGIGAEAEFELGPGKWDPNGASFTNAIFESTGAVEFTAVVHRVVSEEPAPGYDCKPVIEHEEI
jgi:hypothetical protein